jgi:hypothetical protein
MAKRFFYVCTGLFLLVLSYHFGARSATAQAPGNPVVATVGSSVSSPNFVFTANGDFYYSQGVSYPYHLQGNIFSGATEATPETFGQLKARYR